MTLALIAGQGGLPPHLVRVLLARGEVPVICEIEQFPSEVKGDLPRIGVRLERFGTFLGALRDKGVTRLCMAGAMRRPPVDPSLIDAATLPFVPRIQAGLAQGDDGTLRTFIEIFEEQGIAVVGAADIDPGLLPDAGLATGTLPDGVEADISAAEAALAEMGRADLGQAVVVRGGQVIAREDERGTDAMLQELQSGARDVDLADDPFEAVGAMLDNVADWLSGPEAEAARRRPKGQNALLFKAPKPGQELRADMPVIGPTTAMRAVEAGLAGIVIQAGGVMVLEPEAVLGTLRQNRMFLWVRPRGGGA